MAKQVAVEAAMAWLPEWPQPPVEPVNRSTVHLAVCLVGRPKAFSATK
jgi:hypothetical protein